MSALPRGPFPGEEERNRLARARVVAQELWRYWDGNTLIPLNESYREQIQQTLERLLMILEE
jgi:hypothetical protein